LTKGEKAELEARFLQERADKNKALLEKVSIYLDERDDCLPGPPTFNYMSMIAHCQQEQFRAALQRTARALKREQGRHLTNIRQELEQLKIEYLAR